MCHFRKLPIFVLMMLILFPSARLLTAQEGSVALNGIVTDPSGLPVVGAKVQAVNSLTSVPYTTETNDAGRYSLPTLPPGTYQIAVNKDGFERQLKTDVQLHVADVVAINFALKVGQVTQTVTVTGGAPIVNTSTSSLGGLVQEDQVSDLPLNGRNYINLTLMQPGVATVPNMVRTASTAGTWFSANGAGVRSNNFTLDGAIMQDLNSGATATLSGTTLGLDGIAEYRVLTNSYNAEYGLVMGSQTVMVSKGGTNSFHGSAFEYLRNSVLDAANYFDTPAGSGGHRLPEFRRNNFGASFGGPIKKDRTFFFATYEGLREQKGITTVTNTLGAGCHGAAGTTITNSACPQLTSTSSVVIAPVVAPIVALYPSPNLPNNQLTFNFGQPNTDNYGQIRIDHRFSDKDAVFVRYTIDDDLQIATLPYPEFTSPALTRHQYATLGETHIFSPSLLNTFRFSYSRTAAAHTAPTDLVGPGYSFVPNQPVPQISVAGLTILGPVKTPFFYDQNLFSFSDDIAYTRNRHTLKFGTLINVYRQGLYNGSTLAGQINFSNIAAFLKGQSTNYTAATYATPSPIRHYLFDTLGFYIQDDWQVRRRLTLNLGLRYEPVTQITEANGISSSLINPLKDPAYTVGLLFQDPSYHNFSPRLGLAWDVRGDGKTAVRAGSAIFYDVGNMGSGMNTLTKGLPPFSFSSTTSVTLSFPFNFPASAIGKSGNETYQYYIQQPRLYTYNLAVEQQLPFSMALSVAYAGSRGLHLDSVTEGNPNAALANPADPWGVFWPANTAPINSNWGDVVVLGSHADSNYNALQVTLTKRMSSGLQFQSSYTWARSIDDTESQATGDSTTSPAFMADPFNTRYDRALSDLNLSQVWVLNGLYSFPNPQRKDGVVGHLASGWAASGIFTAQTGVPFTPVEATLRSRSGVNGASPGNAGGIDRPDLNPSFTGPVILGGPIHYFNPNAFVLQPVGTLGTAGRNSLIGPGLAELDFAIRKETPLALLGEQGNLEFRAEAFNLFNRPNFSVPNNIVFSGVLANATEPPLSTAGQITSTATTSRQIQVSLRLTF